MRKIRLPLLLEGLAVLLWAQTTQAGSISCGAGASCTTTGITVSATGTFGSPEDVFLDSFTLTGSTPVTVQTYGFGGGTNAAGAVISAGGFDSLVALFSGSATAATGLVDGSGNPIASADNFFPANLFLAGCPPAGTVTIGGQTGICGDNTLTTTLLAGTYTLALTNANFIPLAINPGPPFTPLGPYDLTDTTSGVYGGTNGAYNDLTGGAFQTCNNNAQCITDSANFAVDITGAGVITPEPGTLLMLGAGLLGVASLRKRLRSTT